MSYSPGMKIYSVYDSKVEAYLRPFFCRSKGEALRSFIDAVSDAQSPFFKYPGDFTLFEIGEFDDLSGRIKAHLALINLGNALEFKSAEMKSKNVVELDRSSAQ